MRIVVLAEAGRGQSTLAAVVARALAAEGIPVETVDSPGSSADDLLADPVRLARNVASVAARAAAAGGRVVVEVKPISREPASRAGATAVRMSRDAADKYKAELADVTDHPPGDIRLFGSRVFGSPRPDSDLDVAVLDAARVDEPHFRVTLSDAVVAEVRFIDRLDVSWLMAPYGI